MRRGGECGNGNADRSIDFVISDIDILVVLTFDRFARRGTSSFSLRRKVTVCRTRDRVASRHGRSSRTRSSRSARTGSCTGKSGSTRCSSCRLGHDVCFSIPELVLDTGSDTLVGMLGMSSVNQCVFLQDRLYSHDPHTFGQGHEFQHDWDVVPCGIRLEW
jgi:hypothetical protein